MTQLTSKFVFGEPCVAVKLAKLCDLLAGYLLCCVSHFNPSRGTNAGSETRPQYEVSRPPGIRYSSEGDSRISETSNSIKPVYGTLFTQHRRAGELLSTYEAELDPLSRSPPSLLCDVCYDPI